VHCVLKKVVLSLVILLRQIDQVGGSHKLDVASSH